MYLIYNYTHFVTTFGKHKFIQKIKTGMQKYDFDLTDKFYKS